MALEKQSLREQRQSCEDEVAWCIGQLEPVTCIMDCELARGLLVTRSEAGPVKFDNADSKPNLDLVSTS